jgi:hypothetical protein
VGLMQVIGPTYRSNKDSRHDVGPYLYGTSIDPLSNVLASMHYALGRYGSLSAAYDRAGGYDNGGPLLPGRTLVDNRSGEIETVLNRAQGDALESRIRGGDGASAEMVAALLAELRALRAAVQDARPINVYPREQQSEQSIAAAIATRTENSRRLR